MIKRVDHIAIVVKNLDEALQLYNNVFGVKPSKIETLEKEGVKAAILHMGEEGEIELLEPINPQGGVAKFLETRGEGIHHICLEVDNIERELKALADRGVQMLDKQSRPGLAGMIGFIHPKATKGVLYELAEKVDKKH